MNNMQKSKLFKLILIATFWVLLTVPNVLFLNKSDQAISTTEKRELAKFPKIKETGVKGFASAFDAFYSDNLPFRNSLIWTGSFLQYNLLKDSPSDNVILGKDDWLFYNYMPKNYRTSFSDYFGEDLFNESELKDAASKITNLSNYVEKNGGTFLMSISPNKETVYSEYLPSGFGNPSSVNLVTQLKDYMSMNEQGVSFIYAPEYLIQNKSPKYLLYYKGDSHWNSLGAFLGFETIMGKYDKDFSVIQNFSILQNDCLANDLTDLASIKWYDYGKNYSVDNYKPEITFEATEEYDDQGRNIWTSVSSNKNGKKLVIWGDSFSVEIRAYFAKEFEEVVFLNRTYEKLSPETIDELNADVFLFHMVQRSVTNISSELDQWT